MLFKTVNILKQLTLLIPTLALLTTGCARKNPHFFDFKKSKTTNSITTIKLPTIKKIHLTQTTEQSTLTWQEITAESYESINPELEFIGYNIYRFTPHSFIPSIPYNKEPLTATIFYDLQNKKQPNKKYCYMIKAVFMHQEKTIEGPGSRIISTINVTKA